MSRRIKRTNPKPRSRDERKEARPFKARGEHKAGPRPGGKPPRFASERAEKRAPVAPAPGPVTPCAPVGPVGPVDPVGPGAVGPVGPVDPVTDGRG